MSQPELAAAAGLSVQTVRMIEGAKQESIRPLTLGALDRGLKWQVGSAEAIVLGAHKVADGVWYLVDSDTIAGTPKDVPAREGADYLARRVEDTPLKDLRDDEILAYLARRAAERNPDSPHYRPDVE